MFTRATRKSAADLTHARQRLDRLAFLRAPQVRTLLALPAELEAMHAAVAALPPPPDLAPEAAVPELGKRPWETSKTGYVAWAVEQLMERAKERARGEPGEGGAFSEGRAEVAATAERTKAVGRVGDLKRALEMAAGGGVRSGKGKGVETMDTRPG